MARAPTPLNDRQRRFAELVVGGMPGGRAYEAAGYQARGHTADQAASRMLMNVKVADHVAKLRAEAAERAAITRDELVAWLSRAVRKPVGEVTEMDELAQEVVRRIDEAGATVERVKVVGKLEAARQLAAMLGWNAPQKMELDVADPLAQLIREVRQG